ncbi:Rgg/GadR/MutR family transcriptional regulator [Streptococcus salivarius]|jgi:Rgg/GadR/MutR family transcriptional activator|uniref:Rgg/GadR/MutR family transcriptional regulator n=1 Tax=Streptococcus salivarius TaxID=1304 RepID=UPI00321BEF06
MKKYGEVFRLFRESRGLKLKDVAKSGISTSHLSRFENGEAELTFSKLIIALNEINVSIEEFIYVANDFCRDELNNLLEQIRQYVSTNDVNGMKNLLISQIEKKNKRESFYKNNIILVKIRLQDISGESYYNEDDLAYLSDYLFSVEYWGNYELLLFANTLDVLNHKLLMTLAREMCRRTDFYKEIPTNRRLISSMLLNCYITCIERRKSIDAVYFEKQLRYCSFFETEMYEKLVFQYANNLYKYVFEDDKLAILEMRKCIGAMKLIGSNHIANKYERHLNGILKNKSN